MDKVYEKISIPLSDSDIRNHLGSSKIVEYGELKNYDKITDLLPRKLDYAIILPQRKKGEGHWICLARRGNNIYHYDSLGNRPDKYLKWTPRQLRRSLGQDEPHLSHLLNDWVYEGKNVRFNDLPYQSSEPHVQTCGRHVVNFIKHFMYEDGNLKSYFKQMKNMKKRYNQNYDLLVSQLVP